MVNDCQAKVLFAEVRYRDGLVASADAPKLMVKVAIGGEAEGFLDYDDVLAGEDGSDITDLILGNAMLYTSGTTGRPKGVYRKAINAIPFVLGGARNYDHEKDVQLLRRSGLSRRPARHRYPRADESGRACGVHRRPLGFLETVLATIEKYGVTHGHMVERSCSSGLLALPLEVKAKYDLSSLRAVIHGAAPCPPDVKRAMIEWLGPILSEYYAGSEGGGGFTISPEEWLKKPGSVGKRSSPDSTRVLDDEGNEVSPGESGTLYFKVAAANPFEYFNDPAKTAASHRDGYFTLGDIGYFDEDDYLFLTGRSAEIIISGGVNIYPQEVDNEIIKHPAVEDSCAIGVPNEEWGEEVKVVIMLNPGFTPSDELAAEIIGFARTHLAGFKVPRSVDFVDELPRSPAGKIQRGKVRAPFWAGRKRADLGEMIGALMSRLVRALLASLFLAVVFCGPARAADAVGDWLGTLTVQPGLDLRIAIHVSRSPAGVYSATWDSLDEGLFDDPLSNVSVAGDNLSFDVPRLNAAYVGKWDAASGRWVGVWAQAGHSLPLAFAKGLAPPAPTVAGLDGEWDGTLDMGVGLRLRLALHIITGPHGTLGTYDSVDQGGYGARLSSIERDGDHVRIVSKLSGFVIDGALIDGGQTLVASFTQGGGTLPLTLKRLPPGAASPWPAPGPRTSAVAPTHWTPPSDAEIRALLAQRIDVEHQGVGIVIGVIDPSGRRIIAYGKGDQPDGRPLDGDTEFEIGSITKVFTALVLADMVRDGEVKLDDPAQKYLPAGVTMPTRDGKEITLVDLATHTSGLPRLPTNFAPKDPANPYADYTAKQLYQFLSSYQLTRDPGASWAYSNLGFGLLGHLLSLRRANPMRPWSRRGSSGRWA